MTETDLPSVPPKPSVFTRYWGAALGMFLVMAGMLFTWLLWRNFQKAQVAHGWSPTPCLILESRVEEFHFSPRSEVSYIPRVRYQYQTDGKIVVNTQLRLIEHRSGKRDSIEKIVKEFPAGKQAQCWVNPDNTDQAILQLPSKAAGYSLWFPLLFVVGGAGMIRGSLKARRTADRA